jgi:hypothetical protein
VEPEKAGLLAGLGQPEKSFTRGMISSIDQGNPGAGGLPGFTLGAWQL